MASKLTEAQKVGIVMALACFDRPSAVIAMMKAEHGLEMLASHVTYYDPTTYAGRYLKAKYVELFHETRAAFKAGLIEIPIADRAARLRMLDGIAGEAREVGNLKMALRAVEQAAKEVGDVYTNKIAMDVAATGEIHVSGGLPDVPLGELPSEARQAAIAAARERTRYEPRNGGSVEPPAVIADLVEEGQLSANASPADRAAFEQHKKDLETLAERDAANLTAGPTAIDCSPADGG